MSFKLPFPTLKLLTMVQVGKAMLNRQLRPPNEHFVAGNYMEFFVVQVDEIMKLQILPATKHEFSDVLKGMQGQIALDLVAVFIGAGSMNFKKLEFLFDVHGKLDSPTIWKRYIHSQVSDLYSPAFDRDPLDTLVKLLQFARDRNSWHGIYAVLSKIASFDSLNPDGAWLESGKLVLVHGEYTMFYCFSDPLTSQTASKVHSRFLGLFQDSTSIDVHQQGLYFRGVHFDRLFFQDYFKDAQNSLSPEEKFAFLRDTIFDKYHHPSNMRCAIDILRMLDQETAHRCFVAILDMHIGQKDMFFCELLFRCCEWPLTHLLLPLLEYAEPHLTLRSYEYLIYSIVSFCIPERAFFTVHHIEVFEKFWEAIPSHIKQDLRLQGSSLDGLVNMYEMNFKNSLKLLSESNTYLFVRISTELWPEESLYE